MEPTPSGQGESYHYRHSEYTLQSVNEIVSRGNVALSRLVSAILSATGQKDVRSTQRIESFKQGAVRPQYRIGVIGATGSGKSSLLNALLDEDQLLPTSNLGACTAVVIEILYNQEDDTTYRAEIDFVTKAEWLIELENLRKDVLEGKGRLSDAGSEAQIAWKTLQAVYPFLENSSDLEGLSAAELSEMSYVQHLLDARDMKALEAETGSGLKEKLRRYVEGRETTSKLGKVTNLSIPEMLPHIDCWPLIKKIRIFCKAEVLSTGCILVDLPGVADANQARGIVAKKYLSNCSSLWVVAPIIRAKSDGIAKNLLSEQLQRQLRRQGLLDRIVFVCSKSDEMVVQELENKFQSDIEFVEKLSVVERRMDLLSPTRSKLERDITDLKARLQEAAKIRATVRSEKTAYKQLKEMSMKGEKVYPPLPPREKRAAEEDPETTASKQSKISLFSFPSMTPTRLTRDLSIEGRSVTRELSKSNDKVVEQDTTQTALTTIQIESKLRELRESHRKLSNAKADLDRELVVHKCDLRAVIEELNDLEDLKFDAYHAARNKHCVEEIRLDFARSLRLMEVDDAQNDDIYDPDTETETAVEPQNDLPVFCVSSQSFQRLCGRLGTERISRKFKTIEQTGVPALTLFCYNLGQEQMKTFLIEWVEVVQQIVSSVRFWLTAGRKSNETGSEDDIFALTTQMTKDIEKNVYEVLDAIHDLLLSQLFKNFPTAVSTACQAAVGIVRKWRLPKDDSLSPQDRGLGLRYQTYKAVVRRGGAFDRRGINFGEDLVEPLMKAIDKSWVPVFHTLMPEIIARAQAKCRGRIAEYIKLLPKNPEFLSTPPEVGQRYIRQLKIYKKRLAEIINSINQALVLKQREALRVFDEVVGEKMRPVYIELTKDCGPGVYGRMTVRMEQYVNAEKKTIFDSATQGVQRKLLEAFREVSEATKTAMEKTVSERKDDCENLFKGAPRGVSKSFKENKSLVVSAVVGIEKLLASLEAGSTSSTIPHSESADKRSDAKQETCSQEQLPQPTSLQAAHSSTDDDGTKDDGTADKVERKQSPYWSSDTSECTSDGYMYSDESD